MDRRDVLKYTALLTGYAVTAPLASALLSGCQAEPDTGGYAPKFFTNEEYATIAEMAETMLPPTKTPGAKELGVPQFIDLMMTDYSKPEDQERWRAGLQGYMQAAEENKGKAFTRLGADDKLAYLNEVDAAAKTEAEALDGTPPELDDEGMPIDRYPFFLRFKSAAVGAYFSSEKIGTEVLAYDPVPGQYSGCMPLEDNGGVSWSL
ncbi:MAG: gluconate 2-dehydrogenase subunit 3 family protein [Lewinella sp.]|nr:gluconate 2-dehydrogenase subunit 3 family protein [Lewinella sp.]